MLFVDNTQPILNIIFIYLYTFVFFKDTFLQVSLSDIMKLNLSSKILSLKMHISQSSNFTAQSKFYILFNVNRLNGMVIGLAIPRDGNIVLYLYLLIHIISL